MPVTAFTSPRMLPESGSGTPACITGARHNAAIKLLRVHALTRDFVPNDGILLGKPLACPTTLVYRKRLGLCNRLVRSPQLVRSLDRYLILPRLQIGERQQLFNHHLRSSALHIFHVFAEIEYFLNR